MGRYQSRYVIPYVWLYIAIVRVNNKMPSINEKTFNKILIHSLSCNCNQVSGSDPANELGGTLPCTIFVSMPL